jgi:hypothetical protein
MSDQDYRPQLPKGVGEEADGLMQQAEVHQEATEHVAQTLSTEDTSQPAIEEATPANEVVIKPEEKKRNLRLPCEEYDEDEEKPTSIEMALHGPGGRSDTGAERRRLVKDIKDQERKPTAEESRHYMSLERADEATWPNGDYDDLFPNDAEITQFSEVDGDTIRMKSFRPRPPKGSTSGSAFTRAARSKRNKGREVTIPLWHSGFRITVGNFGSVEIFRLTSRLKEIRDNIGLRTTGLLYSTDDVHITTAIMDFILDHTLGCSLQGWQDREVLEAAIRVPDISHILAGALEAQYPSGYPFVRECINLVGENRCDYSSLPPADRIGDIAKFDFLRSSVKNESKFPVACKRFMCSNEVTSDDLENYRKTLRNHNSISETFLKLKNDDGSRTILVGDVPSYYDYKQEGLAWIENIVSIAQGTIQNTQGMTRKQIQETRIARINELMTSVKAQRQSCWVAKMIIEDGEDVSETTDRDTIMETLLAISEDEKDANEIVEAIFKYSKSRIYSGNFIANWQCPKCQKGHGMLVDPQYNLIPVSMSAYFFNTLVLRLAQKS